MTFDDAIENGLPENARTLRTSAEWRLAATDDALATLLFGRANRLRNELAAAATRDTALEAGVAYIFSVRALAATFQAFGDDTGMMAVRWLRACTDDAFTADVLRRTRAVSRASSTPKSAPANLTDLRGTVL